MCSAVLRLYVRFKKNAVGALAGIRVVETGQLIAGPFCGHLFADHGAEVIKVESPGDGDPMRTWGGVYKGVGLYWPILSRQKKSVTLNLRETRAQELLKDLLKTADVFLENFRPGTLERWGLGWPEVHALNPKLIMIRITGYGQTGPYRDRAGFGAIGEAMSGFRHLSGEPGRPPVRVGISIGDSLAATHGFIGGLLALFHRDRPGGTGRGQVVDVGIYEAMWAYMESILPEFEKLGVLRQPTGSFLPGIAPSNVYPTADGEWVVIGANQDNVFKRFAAALGHAEWAAPGADLATHHGRGARQAELDDWIVSWTSGRTTADVLDTMEKAAVPAGRIYTAADIAQDPHYAAREMIIEVPDPGLHGEGVRMQGVVPRLSDSPGHITRGGPLLGEHNAEVWGALVSAAVLADLGTRGVI
jgi:crotonobetainyl-CoA:carnitine CoA-transferase CaiB-like acyl-CoA transferase